MHDFNVYTMFRQETTNDPGRPGSIAAFRMSSLYCVSKCTTLHGEVCFLHKSLSTFLYRCNVLRHDSEAYVYECSRT